MDLSSSVLAVIASAVGFIVVVFLAIAATTWFMHLRPRRHRRR